MSFNPNATATIGNEWRAYKKGTAALISAAQAHAVYVNSSATETIDSLLLPYSQSGSASSYGKLWAEVYNAADLGTIDETPTVYTFTPNEDVSVSNIFYNNGASAWNGPVNNGASNVDQYIDDTTDESSDYLHWPNGATLRMAFNTAALAAGRVLSVSFEVRAFGYWGSSPGLWVDLYNGSSFVKRLGTLTATADSDDTNKNFQNYTFGPFYVNPLTEEPWTRTDIINMDTGTNLLLQLYSTGNNSAVAAVRMKVSMITEKRLAVGANTKATTPPSGVQTTNVHSLKTPAGVDNWAKSSGTDYLVVVRRLDDPQGSLPSMTTTFNTIEATAANPHDQGHVYDVTVEASGKLTVNTGITVKASGLLMATSGGALSADSQVYHDLLSGAVYGAVESEQRLSNAASTTYGTVRAIVGVPTSNPAGSLLLKIKRNSDNTQMGGTGTLTVADLASQTFLGISDNITWYDVTVALASNATLVSGTQYYIEVSSPSSAVGAPWYVRGLDYTESHSFTTDQSYGGSTDSMILAGTAYAQGDLLVTAQTTASEPAAPPAPPGTPGSMTVNVVSYALPDAGDPTCDPGSTRVPRLVWGTTSEGVLFDYYGIERSEDGGTTWVLVKRVQTESINTWDDVEAKRGVALKYRIRVVRTTGQVGAYLTQSNTVVAQINTTSVIFCTNDDATLLCGYVRLGGEFDYNFLSDNEVSLVAMHERPKQVMFRPTEDRGVSFPIPVLIFTRGNDSNGTETPPDGPGVQAFDALRAIVESDAPYVCLHTPDGERFFCGLRLPSGRRIESAGFYAVTITAFEVASEPAVVD